MNDKPFSVENQLPCKLQAVKCRQRGIVGYNKSLDASHQITMKYEEGELLAEGEKCVPKVKVPSASDILRASKEQQLQRSKVQINSGNKVVVGSSTFLAYTATVKDLDEVSDTYASVRELHADARHVMCAFRLPHREFYKYQDYQDDDEHAGGKLLLHAMCQSEMFNRAIFVVRHYDGEHIGECRFTAILDAAKSMVTINPYNSILDKNQYLWTGKDKPGTVHVSGSGAHGCGTGNRGRGTPPGRRTWAEITNGQGGSAILHNSPHD